MDAYLNWKTSLQDNYSLSKSWIELIRIDSSNESAIRFESRTVLSRTSNEQTVSASVQHHRAK